MMTRMLAALGLLSALLATNARAQDEAKIKQGGTGPVPMSTLLTDLKAAAPQTRNAAAYQLAGMGPAAAPAIPALIEALQDPSPAVRYPVTIALREIGPKAKAAIPALKKVADEDISDEVAASARRAIRAIDPTALDDDEKKADKD
jgi:HEAT repeat protein